MARQSEHITSFFTARGEDAAEKMHRLMALADELGNISVTHVAGTQAEWFGMSPAELWRERRLEWDTYHAVRDVQPHPAVYGIGVQLLFTRVSTLRDVLVLGRERLTEVAGLSDRGIARTEAALASAGLDETLLDRPEVSDIAGLCFRLDQVHGGALRTYAGFVKTVRKRGSEDELYECAGLSVGDMVDPSMTDTMRQILNHDDSPGSRYETCCQEALVFAAEFAIAREALEQGAG